MSDMLLNSGYTIPSFGFGTWQSDPSVCREAVACALQTGFRHIDTAASYGNEKEVGQGIADASLERADIFVTTKVWNTDRGYDSTLRAFEKSMDFLGLDYVDLYLIHWPANPFQFDNWKQINADTWRAMERLVDEGVVRSIGLSNFMPRHIKPLMAGANIAPAVDQIEFHPGWMQKECVDFCVENGIAVEAWSPLANGDAFKMPLLQELSAKYGVSIPLIVLSWVMNHGVIPLSKSVTPSRIAENFTASVVHLSPEDIAAIDLLGPCGGKCRNPDLVPY